jgi:hypothetical protein
MCEEHARLLNGYLQSVATFSTTLNAIAAAGASVPRDEYDRLAGYVEQSRLKSDQARTDLERHATEHGCYPCLSATAAHFSGTQSAQPAT